MTDSLGRTPQSESTQRGLTDQGREEFDAFYRATHQLLHRKAERLTQGDRRQAEDAVMDTYLRALARWQDLKVLDCERRAGWLLATLANVWREQRRAVSRRPTLEPFPDTGSGDTDPIDGCVVVAESAVMRIAYAQVLDACERVLTGRRYEVFIMVFLGFRQVEIAAMRDIKPGTVRTHFSSALAMLREDPKVADVLALLREEGTL